MVKIIWTNRAISQLEHAVKYILDEQGKTYAETVLNKILNSTRNLYDFPKMGQIEYFLSHKKSEYRYLLVWSYKIVYKISNEKVVISRIFHTSQNPSKLK
jgi:plasmid stabilization system protein ParE